MILITYCMSAKVNDQLRNICICHFLVAEAVRPVYDFCGKTAEYIFSCSEFNN